ncbi:MAG: hypothetical protein AAGA80_23450, partial [Cyanobacteria bacterium P01_F01_bin.143]
KIPYYLNNLNTYLFCKRSIIQKADTVIIGKDSKAKDSSKPKSGLDKEQNQEKQYSRTFVFTGTLTADDESEKCQLKSF